MAIINSSIAYSGKNKLGTMILRTVKGQLIASQYQPAWTKGTFATLTDQCKHFDGFHQPLPWHSESATACAGADNELLTV